MNGSEDNVINVTALLLCGAAGVIAGIVGRGSGCGCVKETCVCCRGLPVVGACGGAGLMLFDVVEAFVLCVVRACGDAYLLWLSLSIDAGDNPLVMTVGLNTDIAGNPIRGKDYTQELASLITRTAGGVSCSSCHIPPGARYFVPYTVDINDENRGRGESFFLSYTAVVHGIPYRIP